MTTVGHAVKPITEPLLDRFGRTHTSLRVSVTDRCNIRCFYCMPADERAVPTAHELLTFEEITSSSVAAMLGVNSVRSDGRRTARASPS